MKAKITVHFYVKKHHIDICIDGVKRIFNNQQKNRINIKITSFAY